MNGAARWERWHALGIGSKLTAAFGVLAGVTVLVVLLALLAGQHLTRDIALAENLRRPASLASTQAQASLLSMQLHVRGYLVLSDPQDVQQYQVARREFEDRLAALQAMSNSWAETGAARLVSDLTTDYRRWEGLPKQLFDLHDNPLKNQPALRLCRVDVQARRVQVLDGVSRILELQRSRESSPHSRELVSDLLRFQTSFDAMVTNLIAYGASGELSFKLAYGPQLSTNAAAWNAVAARRLWPRSLLGPFIEEVDLTGADRRSYTSYATAQRYRESQDIDVSFHDGGSDGSGSDESRPDEGGSSDEEPSRPASDAS
jgi:hypothetical protein